MQTSMGNSINDGGSLAATDTDGRGRDGDALPGPDNFSLSFWKYVLVERPIGTACADIVAIADSVGENLKCFYSCHLPWQPQLPCTRA